MWFYKLALLALLDQTAIPAVKGQKASTPYWTPFSGEFLDMNSPSPGSFTCPAATNSFLDFCIQSEHTLMTSDGIVPPDTHGAAGPNSLCSVVTGAFIQCIRRDGTSIATFPVTSFATLLSDLGPTSFLFDPKVVYDVHADRFVIVVLSAASTSPTSFIFVAVSKTNDPLTGTINDWYRYKMYSGDIFADYPGLAVDEEAIYITANMYAPESFYSNLWIIPKSPFYSGGAPTSAVYDFMALSGSDLGAATTMPAMVRAPAGTGIPNDVGTYLITHLGDDGSHDLMNICLVKNPLAVTPSFGCYQLADPRVSFDGPFRAPQLGNPATIDTSDGRTLQAVWADNFLWTTFTVWQSNGQSAVYWGKFNANGVDAPTLAGQGKIDGEDIQAATWTFMASLDVNSKGVAAFGFTASSKNMYASAYATIRYHNGVVHTPQLIQAGLGPYSVDNGGTGGGGDVRWGDYSGTSLDPLNDDCFWTFQEYAGDTTADPRNGVGHWRTVWARICANVTNAPTQAPTVACVKANKPCTYSDYYKSLCCNPNTNVCRQDSKKRFKCLTCLASNTRCSKKSAYQCCTKKCIKKKVNGIVGFYCK